MLILSLALAYVLIVWFKTDAFVEYAKALGLDKWIIPVNNYILATSEIKDVDFVTFLKINHNCFFTRLLSCPICISFWLSFLCWLFYSPLLFITYGMAGFIVIGIPVLALSTLATSCLSLFWYAILDRIY